jgi:4-amino-4-deoxy-L-arabinose transferase-like glycosyltransferase
VRAWIAANLVVVGLLSLLTVAGGALRVEPAANPSEYQSVDERAYARLARNLARHGSYDAPEMADPVRWPPGAPFVFAAAHKVRPVITEGERWDVPSAYPLQWVFSTATIPATFLLAFLLAGPVAGLLAAGAIAFYPPLINATGDLLTEPLGSLMLAIALCAVILALRRRTWQWAAGAGLLLGLTVLVRADLVAVPLLLVVLLGVVVWRAEGRRRGLVLAGAMLAGILVPAAPWSAYVSSVAGKPVPVSSGGASNLFVGTYVPGDGSMFGLKRELADEVGRRYPELAGEPFFRLPQQRVIDTVAARRPDLDREAALRAAARENISDHVLGDPIGFTAMAGRKVWRLWGDYTVGTFRNQRAWITAYHLLLVALAFAGLAAALVRGPRRSETAVVAIVAAYVTAVNIVLVSEARHNLPIMPALVAGGFAGLLLALRGLPAKPTLPRRSRAVATQ